MIKLVGIALMASGFAMRLNPLLVVVAAAVATGWSAGMGINDVMALFGRLFVDNRMMTLPVILMLPVVGLLEKHGLQERAQAIMARARAATAGRVLLAYTAVRQLSIAFGVNIGGHAAAVRPLVAPMAEGAARASGIRLDEERVQLIRAHAAAAENIGNFFGEDIFIAVGGVLLMKGFFDSNGMDVGVWSMALWGIPTALVAFAAMALKLRRLDRRLAATAVGRKGDAP